jgi:hypothetical protein
MTPTAPTAFARELAPLLADKTWAIGGDTLLHRLGLEAAPRDLDLVTTAADFAAVRRVLAEHGRDVTPEPPPDYATRYFARFETDNGLTVDLIAELAIRLERGVFRWPFDADAIELADELPWCSAEDWALLYRLIGRDECAAALDAWLAEHGVARPDRLADCLTAGYPEQRLVPLPEWWPWDE